MCGIFGWIKPTANTETDLDLVELFKKGLVYTQERGEDATGFYTPGTGIVKDAIDAEEFVMTEIPDSIAKERFIIGHCRMASAKYGDDNVTNPKNAQPFESNNWILIHNGTINTPKLKGYSYTSDVDSEVIISYAEKTSIKNALASIDGSATVVLYNKKDRKIYFWTNGERPLVIAMYKGIIFFASTKKILRKTLKFSHTLGIFPDASFATVYENEPLVYDLKKNRFTRQAIVEKKVAKKVSTSYQSDSFTDSKYRSYQPVTPSNITKNIPRGCGPSCPPSTQKVIGYCPGNGGNGKVVRISSNGDKSYSIQ